MAIDPGSNKIGISIVECCVLKKIRIIYSESVFLDMGQLKDKKLLELINRVIYVAQIYNQCSVIIETVFIEDNKSLLTLELYRGGIVSFLFSFGFKVIHFAPTLMKKIVTGNGHSIKCRVGQVVCSFFQILKAIPEDMIDSISLNIAYSFFLNFYF